MGLLWNGEVEFSREAHQRNVSVRALYERDAISQHDFRIHALIRVTADRVVDDQVAFVLHEPHR